MEKNLICYSEYYQGFIITVGYSKRLHHKALVLRSCRKAEKPFFRKHPRYYGFLFLLFSRELDECLPRDPENTT
jgi:hypothetical protein